jgi:hypothetical protein
MSLGGKTFPAESPHGQESGLQKKGQGGLDRQEGAENVPHIAGIPGPVGAELKFQSDPGHHTHCKVNQENLSPELGSPEVVLVAGAHVHGFHDGDEDGQAQGEGHEQEMEKGCGRKLQAGKQECVHLCVTSLSNQWGETKSPNPPAVQHIEVFRNISNNQDKVQFFTNTYSQINSLIFLRFSTQ